MPEVSVTVLLQEVFWSSPPLTLEHAVCTLQFPTTWSWSLGTVSQMVWTLSSLFCIFEDYCHFLSNGKILPLLVRNEWTQFCSWEGPVCTCVHLNTKYLFQPAQTSYIILRQTTSFPAKRLSEGRIRSINEGDDWLYWSKVQLSFFPCFSKG